MADDAADMDLLAITMARLYRGGALELRDGKFSRTALGDRMIRDLDNAARANGLHAEHGLVNPGQDVSDDYIR